MGGQVNASPPPPPTVRQRQEEKRQQEESSKVKERKRKREKYAEKVQAAGRAEPRRSLAASSKVVAPFHVFVLKSEKKEKQKQPRATSCRL